MRSELRTDYYLHSLLCNSGQSGLQIKYKYEKKRNDFSSSDQGGLLYKAPLTASVFKDFSACYQHFAAQSQYASTSDQPFVYVDEQGVKIITNVVDETDSTPEGVFALSVAQDGWVQMLALYEAG